LWKKNPIFGGKKNYHYKRTVMNKKKNKPEKTEESEFLMGQIWGIASNTTEEAIKCYLNVLKINPNRIDVHYNLGEVYIRHAIRYFEKVIEFNPNDTDALYYLGKMHASLGYYSHANKNFLKAIELNPDYAEVYYDLSISCRKQGEHDKAAEYLQKASEIETRLEQTYRSLPQAILTPAHTETMDADAETHYKQGLLYAERHNDTLSMQCFLKAIELNPNYTEAWLKLSEKFRNDDEIYLQYLQKVVSTKTHDDSVYNMISVYTKSGNNDKVIECYQKLLAFHPKSIKILDKFAREYRRQNKPEKAIECFRKILKINPKSSRAYNKLGFIYYAQNDDIKAVECFQQAAQLGNRIAQEWLDEAPESKCRKVKLAELIKKHTWEEVSPVFVKAYPKWKKVESTAYKQIFEKLQNLTPVIRDEMTIHIKDNEVSACKNHPQTPEENVTYSIGITPWAECSGMDIAEETREDYSDEEIISHCLWEITFFGFSEETIRKEVDKWNSEDVEKQFPTIIE
jgi:tetratricopeptide (TPR) repeat protein